MNKDEFFSKIQKEHLGIEDGDEIKLEQARGHSFEGKERLYYYNNPRQEDMLIVNDKVVATVNFK